MRGKFGSPNPHLEMMQFDLNSIKVYKSRKSIEPEPTTCLIVFWILETE